MDRILLVNDCKFENLIMRDMLVSLGCEVIISNEFNAISDFRELNCDSIIANFIMKEKTGDKILQQIKYMYPEAKCILSSSNDMRLADFESGVIDGFIHTPITKEKLEKIMQKDSQSFSEHKSKTIPSFCTYCGERVEHSEKKAMFCKYCGGKYKF